MTVPIEGKDVLIKDIVCDGEQKVPPSNAYIVEDYPYGRLRCRMAYWIERAVKGVSKGKFRQVSCTTNPKTGNQIWNKPHSGIYTDILVLYLDGTPGSTFGYVKNDGLHVNTFARDLIKFRERWHDQLDASQLETLDRIEKISRKYSPNEWNELS